MGWARLEEIGEKAYLALMVDAERTVVDARSRLAANHRARMERLGARKQAEERRLDEIRVRREGEERARAEAERIANLPPSEWVDAVIELCDWDRLQRYLVDEDLAEERKQALVIEWLDSTVEGRAKVKEWRKKQRKGTRLGATVQRIMKWAPEHFGG